MLFQDRRTIGYTLAAVTLVLLLVLIGGYFIVLAYLQNTLLPDLAEKAGLTLDEFAIRHIGWGGAELGPIRVNPDCGQSHSRRMDLHRHRTMAQKVRFIAIF